MDLQRQLEQWPVGSAAVAVIGPDGVLDTAAVGAPTPRYRWASITKVISALTVLDAVLDGTLALADPVGPPGSTLAHLLAHCSGVSMDSDRVLAAPGTRRVYSNRGIELAADHLAARTGTAFADELRDRVLDPLGMDETELTGSPAAGAASSIGDLARLAGELLRSTRLLPGVVAAASTTAFPGLSGVLPGFGRQDPNDWGLGCEVRGGKSPHWTSPDNSPGTFGHFGQAGGFLWVDPDADLACVSLSDTAFGPWAADAWPPLSTAVLAEYR